MNLNDGGSTDCDFAKDGRLKGKRILDTSLICGLMGLIISPTTWRVILLFLGGNTVPGVCGLFLFSIILAGIAFILGIVSIIVLKRRAGWVSILLGVLTVFWSFLPVIFAYYTPMQWY